MRAAEVINVGKGLMFFFLALETLIGGYAVYTFLQEAATSLEAEAQAYDGELRDAFTEAASDLKEESQLTLLGTFLAAALFSWVAKRYLTAARAADRVETAPPAA